MLPNQPPIDLTRKEKEKKKPLTGSIADKLKEQLAERKQEAPSWYKDFSSINVQHAQGEEMPPVVAQEEIVKVNDKKEIILDLEQALEADMELNLGDAVDSEVVTPVAIVPLIEELEKKEMFELIDKAMRKISRDRVIELYKDDDILKEEYPLTFRFKTLIKQFNLADTFIYRSIPGTSSTDKLLRISHWEVFFRVDRKAEKVVTTYHRFYLPEKKIKKFINWENMCNRLMDLVENDKIGSAKAFVKSWRQKNQL